MEKETCDLCRKSFKYTKFDARLQGRTAWAWLCPACFQADGVGLGLGKGQQYKRADTKSKWVRMDDTKSLYL